MSHNVVEVDEFTAAVQVTDVDDTNYPTNEANMGQSLANRTRYHENTLTGNYTAQAVSSEDAGISAGLVPVNIPPTARIGGSNPFLSIATGLQRAVKWFRERTLGASVTAIRMPIPIIPAAHSGVLSFQQSNGAQLKWTQLSNLSPFALKVPLWGVPPVCTIEKIWVWVEGDGHSATPQFKPVITLYSQLTSSVTTIATVTDPINYPSYDTVHVIELTVNHDTDPSNQYWLSIGGESGTDSQASGLIVHTALAFIKAKA